MDLVSCPLSGKGVMFLEVQGNSEVFRDLRDGAFVEELLILGSDGFDVLQEFG